MNGFADSGVRMDHAPLRGCVIFFVGSVWPLVGRFIQGLHWLLCRTALIGCLFVPTFAASHESIGSVSNAIVLVHEKTVDYYLSVPPTLKSLMFNLSATAWYRDYFAGTLKIRSGDADCPLIGMSSFARQASGNNIVQLTYRCPKRVKDLTISSEVFLDIDDKHVQLIKLMEKSDLQHVVREGMFSLSHRTLHIADIHSGGSLLLHRVARFFQLGVEHILTGYDHILFLIAVILVSVKLLDTLKMITSFTIAHSITLGLAFMGVISLPSSVVEPLIALTIVYVAFENLLARHFNRRWLLTFSFGLIHGLGFVGVLKEITISRDELLTALVSFNAGIEAGQLLIVIPLGLLFYGLRHRPWRPVFIRWSSVGTGVVGLFWFIERVSFVPLLGAIRRLI